MLPQPATPISPGRVDYFEIPAFYSGSSPVVNYTWHLSVLDAGQPRTRAPDAKVKLAATHVGAAAWQGRHLNGSQWTLISKSKDARRSARQLIFGMPGAIPITGDFNGDGITDIGGLQDGEWFIDLNGNGIWDEGDLWAKLGHEGDLPVTGDWDGDGKTDIGILWSGLARRPEGGLGRAGFTRSANSHTDEAKNIPPAPHRAFGVRASG